MLGISNQHLTPHFVARQYWLTCFAAFFVFTAGIWIAHWQQQIQIAQASCLARLETVAHLAQLGEGQGAGGALDAYMEKIAQEPWFSYVAIVSSQGVVDAHSEKRLVGTTAVEPIGSPINESAAKAIVGIRWHNDAGEVHREYRRPIGKSWDDGSQIRLGMKEPSLFNTSRNLLYQLRFVFVAPLISVLVGSIWIRRSLQPLVTIQRQLRNAATAAEISALDIRRVETENAVSIGWNRIVDYLGQVRNQRPIEKILDARAQVDSHSELSLILNSLSEGIAITDAQGNIQEWNIPFASHFAANNADEDIRGKSIREILDSISLGDNSQQLLAADSLQRTVVAEIISHLGTSDCYLRMARHPLRDSQGHIWTVRDITQQKLADRTRDQFLDSATHELRTPLANIKAYAETLSSNDDVNIELQKEFCNTIDAEATRLARFIDELLDVSSLEAGSMTIQKKNTELERLLTTLVENSRSLMDAKDLSFDVQLPEKMPELNIDKDKITTSLVNLLGNAAKYTPHGGEVTFRVRCEGEWIEFQIEDSGVGIAEDDLAHVFDKFFRSSHPQVQSETGTGLGLSLAKQVFELHGGTITATSVMGEGSIFTARLPLTSAKYHQEA